MTVVSYLPRFAPSPGEPVKRISRLRHRIVPLTQAEMLSRTLRQAGVAHRLR